MLLIFVVAVPIADKIVEAAGHRRARPATCDDDDLKSGAALRDVYPGRRVRQLLSGEPTAALKNAADGVYRRAAAALNRYH